MSLTSAQIQTLRADVLAAVDAEIVAARTAGDTFTLAALYNRLAAPDFWVWRTSVRKNEYTQSVGPEGTTFAWTGTGFIGRSQGERDAWRELFNGGGRGDGSVNPSLANVRQAFTDIFSGATAPAPANRAHMAAVSRRKATRAEKIFVADPQNGSTATPATMVFEGDITSDDMIAVLAG